MAARRARAGSKKKKTSKPLMFIGAGALIGLLAVLSLSGGLVKSARSSAPTPNFRIADYRRDGSRFASSGNVYVFEGAVENIETIGNDRMVCISIPGNPEERLPLLVPAHLPKRVNITRGDRFLFEASCRTGRTAEGEQVKGVLVVQNVETR